MKSTTTNFLFQTIYAAGLFLLPVLGLLSQPSGGPYGPVTRNYTVPADAQNVFYVSPDGDPNASGHNLDCPTTFAKAIASSDSGDAIILRGGVYRTGSIIFNQAITIQPYAGENPILKGTEIATNWEKQDNGLWRCSWEKLFPAEPASWWRRHRHGQTTPLYWFNNDMVFFDGRLLRPVGWEGEIGWDSYYVDYKNAHVYIGRNPDKHLVEITAHDNALTRTITEVHGKSPDAKGPSISGITFTQYAYRALEFEGTEAEGPADPASYGKGVLGTLLENLTISYCSRVAAYLRGDGLVIRNCLISDTETEGLFILSSSDVLLERNIIRRNNVQNMKGYYPAAVKIFNQSHRVICRDNLVLDNPNSSGIWYDVGNLDGQFFNNWIEDASDGFFFEISDGAIVAGNVFVNCEKGVRSLNSANVEVYHNTFVNSMASFERTERSPVGDLFGWHSSSGPPVDERDGHILFNNLFVADETYHRVLVNTQQTNVLCGKLRQSQMRQMDYNVYVRRGAHPGEPSYGWSPSENDNCRSDLVTLEDFRALGTGFSKHSVEWQDFAGQVLQSIRLRNFHLLPDFPGVSAAGPLKAEVREAIGRTAFDTLYPGAFPPLD